ncbi:MAG: NAD-dependent protein deacetylase [Xanthomonadaceae bacterium]|nr:NAD-dependent protein deacetylase [Xanthomonadaceae bacterium]
MSQIAHSNKESPSHAADALRAWLESAGRVFVITGAGVSTASGIPDYRDVDGEWKRTPPVTYQAFVGDRATYRRYWARSYVGWPIFSRARPSAAHHALATWPQADRIAALVTQNVDGLHQNAGSADVIDLHGRLDRVVCLSCGAAQTRAELQTAMSRANLDWRTNAATAAPDGDADIETAAITGFVAPHCAVCDGLLKPDVVFFGENVPRARYERALGALHASDALLAVGTSLMVYSGFRFARMAHERGLPIAILNRGRTRADALAYLKIEAECGETLAASLRG